MASVLVPLAPGFEEIEAVTVVDLLRRAGVEVHVAGRDGTPVTGSRGITIVPELGFDALAAHRYDAVVLPGGQPGSDNLAADGRILDLLRHQRESGGYVAAICSAAVVLARAGLLDNHRATSFPGALGPEVLARMDYREEPVVVDGKLVTSRGPGTAMDFALTLVSLLVGSDRRQKVEQRLLRP